MTADVERWRSRLVDGRIEWVDAGRLTANPLNPRRHPDTQRAALNESLDGLGWVDIVKVNRRSGRIVDGHARVEEAGARGANVPVLWLDLTDDEETKALAILDPISAMATYDPVVFTELTGLFDGIAPALDQMLTDLLATIPPAVVPDLGGRQIPEATPPPSDPITKAGDLWLLRSSTGIEHTVYCGDSTDPASYRCGPGEAHLVIADPPYWGKVDEEWDQFRDADEFFGFIGRCVDNWQTILHERGTLGVFCAPDFAWQVERETRLRKFLTFNHIVWSKGQDLGQKVEIDAMRRFRPRSERLLLAEHSHNPDALLSAFTQKTGHIAARTAYASLREQLNGLRVQAGLNLRDVDEALGTSGMAGHYFGGSQWCLPTPQAWVTISSLLVARGVNPPTWETLRGEFDAQRREFDAPIEDQITDVWEMSAPSDDERYGHASPKPLRLIEKIVGTCSRPGDVIVDPFGGTGPVLLAAETHGRVSHTIEQAPGYVDVICARWQAVTGEKPILESTGEPADFL